MKVLAFLAPYWLKLAEWACFRAFNYAKRRAAQRKTWVVGARPRTDWTYDQQRVRGNEAAQLLENRHYVEAWDALNADLDTSIMNCPLYGKDAESMALKLVMGKQLLLGLRRELERKVDDGVMADDYLSKELARANRVSVFRR